MLSFFVIYSVSPHLSVRKTGEIFGFFELSCKIALVVEAAKMSYFFNGFIRKAQKLLSVVDASSYYMLEDSFSVDMLIFSGKIVFAYVKL